MVLTLVRPERIERHRTVYGIVSILAVFGCVANTLPCLLFNRFYKNTSSLLPNVTVTKFICLSVLNISYVSSHIRLPIFYNSKLDWSLTVPNDEPEKD